MSKKDKVDISKFISNKQLNKIMHIIENTGGDVDRAYDKIENVFIDKYKVIDLGTNRIILSPYKKNSDYVIKIAGDEHGIEANYREFYNGDLDEKRLTKSYSISAKGVALVQERVKPMTSDMMKKHKKDVREMLKHLEDKLLLVDCKLSNFKNFGIRKNGDIVLLDHGDTLPLTQYKNGKIINMVEETNVALRCREIKKGTEYSRNMQPCDGKLKYSKNYDYFICKKCGSKSPIHDAYKEFYAYKRINADDRMVDCGDDFDMEEYEKYIKAQMKQSMADYAEDTMSKVSKNKSNGMSVNGQKCTLIDGWWVPIPTNALDKVIYFKLTNKTITPKQYLKHVAKGDINDYKYHEVNNEDDFDDEYVEDITPEDDDKKELISEQLKVTSDKIKYIDYDGIVDDILIDIINGNICNTYIRNDQVFKGHDTKKYNIPYPTGMYNLNKLIKMRENVVYSYFRGTILYVCMADEDSISILNDEDESGELDYGIIDDGIIIENEDFNDGEINNSYDIPVDEDELDDEIVNEDDDLSDELDDNEISIDEDELDDIRETVLNESQTLITQNYNESVNSVSCSEDIIKVFMDIVNHTGCDKMGICRIPYNEMYDSMSTVLSSEDFIYNEKDDKYVLSKHGIDVLESIPGMNKIDINMAMSLYEIEIPDSGASSKYREIYKYQKLSKKYCNFYDSLYDYKIPLRDNKYIRLFADLTDDEFSVISDIIFAVYEMMYNESVMVDVDKMITTLYHNTLDMIDTAPAVIGIENEYGLYIKYDDKAYCEYVERSYMELLYTNLIKPVINKIAKSNKFKAMVIDSYCSLSEESFPEEKIDSIYNKIMNTTMRKSDDNTATYRCNYTEIDDTVIEINLDTPDLEDDEHNTLIKLKLKSIITPHLSGISKGTTKIFS